MCHHRADMRREERAEPASTCNNTDQDTSWRRWKSVCPDAAVGPRRRRPASDRCANSNAKTTRSNNSKSLALPTHTGTSWDCPVFFFLGGVKQAITLTRRDLSETRRVCENTNCVLVATFRSFSLNPAERHTITRMLISCGRCSDV